MLFYPYSPLQEKLGNIIYLPAAEEYVEEEVLRTQTEGFLRDFEKGIAIVCEGINIFAINLTRFV